MKQTNDLSKEELERYNRQIILPNFGLDSQKKLKNARVLVIGAGGLGSPVLLYLAAAGVGTIGIVEFDTVDVSNLQRQILYDSSSTGNSKAASAKSRLEALNPHINVQIHHTNINRDNAIDIISAYDIVSDGSDNFQTRYLVNDACVILNKVYVYASIFQWEGQVAVFNLPQTSGENSPNYRDLFPSPPRPGEIPSCAEGGVLGGLPGIIGSMQATEVIKVITNCGEPLAGKLFVFNALTSESTVLKFRKINSNPPITQLDDYDFLCGLSEESHLQEIDAETFKEWQINEELFIIDVREPSEYEAQNIGAHNFPLSELTRYIEVIPLDKKVVIHCQSGKRSKEAINQLNKIRTFNNIYNLKGGILSLQY